MGRRRCFSCTAAREHRAARYTVKRRPVVLGYVERFERIADAFSREQQVQHWSRAKKEALTEGRWEHLIELSGGRDASTSSASEEERLNRGGRD